MLHALAALLLGLEIQLPLVLVELLLVCCEVTRRAPEVGAALPVLLRMRGTEYIGSINWPKVPNERARMRKFGRAFESTTHART